MKYSDNEELKKKKSIRNLFRRSKSKGEHSNDSLQTQLDEMKFARPLKEEVFIEGSSESANSDKASTSYSNDVMYEEEIKIEILKPKNIIRRQPIYGKNIDLNKYSNDLSTYFVDNGLSVDKNSIREMFGCIAASKLIIVKNDSTDIAERFVELFSEFIGAHFFSDEVKSTVKNFEDLFLNGYTFKNAITSANNNNNLINMMVLKKVRLESLNKYFDKVIDFALNPLLPCIVENGNFNLVSNMPNNIWFMVIQRKTSDFLLTETLANSAITIELKAKVVQPQAEVYDNELKLSYEYMSNLLLEGYEEFYLEEIEWKKIDKVEEYLNEFNSFSIDNRLFRQLERYSSTYLMFGGDKYEAMDSMLYAKLLPVISLLKLKRNQNGEEGVFYLFETLFGLEYLTKSKKILKQLQETNRQK